jgi:F-type H+-transporting ATPase subunit epsilon
MANLQVELITASKKLFAGPASEAYLPTAEGEIGVLPGHCNIIGVIKAGECRIGSGEQTRKFTLAGGNFRVTDGKLLILAE